MPLSGQQKKVKYRYAIAYLLPDYLQMDTQDYGYTGYPLAGCLAGRKGS